MIHRQLLTFIDQLRKSKHFEDAALTTVREMLDFAQAILDESRYAKRGRVLRGMVHLRPADGYQRLVVLENNPSSGSVNTNHLPSATAWRWVAKHQRPVAVDVPLSRVRVHGNEGPEVVLEGGFGSQDSIRLLLNREVSHLYAVPLCTWQGTLEGMISVEIECPTAIGQDFIFGSVSEPFQLFADIAWPHLASLPLRPPTAVQTDDLLPVVGSTMAGLVQMLRVFAQQEETLLIGGPTGAGKSRLANWCHEQSPRRGRKFEILDLNTVPEELQMAELFGWRKGAFTGAVRDTAGCVTRAKTGTLFIDEIDKLSLKAQAGLLHLLEARSYKPLGDGTSEQRADVRFIVGTNADLYELVQAGRFREDLYYRINVLPIRIPALSDRLDEVALWARFMVNRRHRETVPTGEARLSAAAERLLCEQQWPGNLRQLDNVVRRAYAFALMTYGVESREIVLEEPNIARALSHERGASRRSVFDTLRGSAAVVVDEAERIAERGGTLDLDLCDAFRGLVLGTAVQRLGGRDAAFRLLGKTAQVQSRNHHKILRRELEKVETLYGALGEQERSPFASLLDEEESESRRDKDSNR